MTSECASGFSTGNGSSTRKQCRQCTPKPSQDSTDQSEGDEQEAIAANCGRACSVIIDKSTPSRGRTTPKNKGETAPSTQGAANSGAISCEMGPIVADLETLIERWPVLSASLKSQIMALVDGGMPP
jgi:hypothetical protein